MLSVPRWLAVYAFLGEQWRDRRRVIADPELDRALARGRTASFGPPGTPARDALDSLVPAAPGRARVWRVTWTAEGGEEARGTRVLAADSAGARLRSDVAWEVALARPSAWRDAGAREAVLDALAEGAARGRTVALLEPLTAGAAIEPALGELADAVLRRFAGARLYALSPVDGVGVFDCGAVGEDAVREGDDADVPIVFDNTLASETPRYAYALALINGVAPPDGMTLVELPGEDDAPEDARDGAGASPLAQTVELLRRQYARARRQAELAELARQASLAELERALARGATLGARVEALERDLADALELRSQALEPARGVASETLEDARADALRAGLVAARWELEQAALELERLTLRPVDALEAEIASLRVQLADAQGDARRGTTASG
ncbi:MAG: hypothetical protein H6713_21110 [Myxococcales bacterium]|nr:hypothetical protein [Myxococcales bacterium]MCB9752462.1 hypothetical protein [Myxococcales bacterium]